MKRDSISQDKMQTILKNSVVERSDEFDFVKNDFTISSFDKDYEDKYQQLCKTIKTKLNENKTTKKI